MRILVAPDKFKGSLTGVQAAEAISRGFLKVWPEAVVQIAPVADGGEGTAEALYSVRGGEWVEVEVGDPLGRQVMARYLWQVDTFTAVLDMSAASGLWRLEKNERDPVRASTFGTGELILHAIRRGAKHVVVGLGGSGTNDGGMGMAAALGYRFLMSDGDLMEPNPANLMSLQAITPDEALRLPEFVAACDVGNPLLGESGATRVFGAQKGADAKAMEFLEAALENLADVAAERLECDFRNEPGAGAAGGLGFGLMTFCGAKIQSGFDVVAECLGLEAAVAGADLVITGEGSLDAQTLEGKAPAGVAKLARKHGETVIAFAGSISHAEQLHEIFDAVCPIAGGPVSVEESMRDAANLLEQSAFRTARLVQLGKIL